MNEINVQSVIYWKVRRLNNTILLNKQYYKQMNPKDIYKQYTMNEINVQSIVYWNVRKLNDNVINKYDQKIFINNTQWTKLMSRV